MKKIWQKITTEVTSPDIQNIQENVCARSDEELVQPIKCGDPVKKCYRASANYVLREIAGESILVSVGDGVADFCGIVNLNASAKVLWNTMQQGATKEALIQALIHQFAVSREKASEDVDTSLHLLLERGLVICD